MIETPDLVTDKEQAARLEKVVDHQLERAVDLLKGLLIFHDQE